MLNTRSEYQKSTYEQWHCQVTHPGIRSSFSHLRHACLCVRTITGSQPRRNPRCAECWLSGSSRLRIDRLLHRSRLQPEVERQSDNLQRNDFRHIPLEWHTRQRRCIRCTRTQLAQAYRGRRHWSPADVKVLASCEVQLLTFVPMLKPKTAA